MWHLGGAGGSWENEYRGVCPKRGPGQFWWDLKRCFAKKVDVEGRIDTPMHTMVRLVCHVFKDSFLKWSWWNIVLYSIKRS